MKRRFYPAALNVASRNCLVIGTDIETLGRAFKLAEAGAKVKVIGDIVATEAANLQKLGIAVLRRPFKVDDLGDEFLVVLSRRMPDSLAEAVAKKCRERRILLAAVDRPNITDVSHMALFEAGRLRMAISTEGASPGLARRIRESFDRSLGAEPVAEFLDHLAKLRARVEAEVPDFEERKKILLAAIEGFELKSSITFPESWISERKNRVS